MLTACSEKDSEERSMVEEWMGKEMLFPEEMNFQIQDIPVEYDPWSADYRILTYIDSTGCTSCKMKLRQWDELIDMFKAIPDVNVNFLMVVDDTVTTEIVGILKNGMFLNPVFFDAAHGFSALNDIPAAESCRTFLLDADDRVLAIGNPVTNPKIRDLYVNILRGNGDLTSTEEKGLCDRPAYNFGIVNPGDSVCHTFSLTNSTGEPYVIQETVPSCDCVSVSASADTLASNGKVDIDVRFSADSIPGEFFRYVDIYFDKKDNPERLMLHGFININQQFIVDKVSKWAK